MRMNTSNILQKMLDIQMHLHQKQIQIIFFLLLILL